MDDSIRFVGKIESSLKNLQDCPLQGNENAPSAIIMIFDEFIESVQDIGIGSELLLLTWLHKADRSILKCVPRNNYDAPKIGVFSTRSPDRPNPIGLHTVRVVSLPGAGMIKVSGLEVLDQTPVIDIKPVWNTQR